MDDEIVFEYHQWTSYPFQIKVCVKRGDINMPDIKGFSPLHQAAMEESLDVIRRLLELGAKINKQNIQGNTPLILAARYGKLENAKFLIQKGAKIHIKNKGGSTAFKMSLSRLQIDVDYSVRETGMIHIAQYIFSLRGPLSLVHIVLNKIEEEDLDKRGLPQVLFQR